jgi:hypothetical protein
MRRSISFNKNEKDLLDYFDSNGKSDIVKEALKFFIKNKDKIIINNLKEIIPLITNNTVSSAFVRPNNKLIR